MCSLVLRSFLGLPLVVESGFAHGMPLIVKRLPITQPWWRRLLDRGPRMGMSRLVIMSCDRASCTEEGEVTALSAGPDA